MLWDFFFKNQKNSQETQQTVVVGSKIKSCLMLVVVFLGYFSDILKKNSHNMFFYIVISAFFLFASLQCYACIKLQVMLSSTKNAFIEPKTAAHLAENKKKSSEIVKIKKILSN